MTPILRVMLGTPSVSDMVEPHAPPVDHQGLSVNLQRTVTSRTEKSIVSPKISWIQILHDYLIFIDITRLERYSFNNMKNFQKICHIHSFFKVKQLSYTAKKSILTGI